MVKLNLSNSFKLQDGREITDLSLCFEELSVADLRQVKKLEAQISDDKAVSAESMSKPKSLSFEFQLATGFLAAVKGTDGLLISDFTRISMTDALAIAEEASFFWLGIS